MADNEINYHVNIDEKQAILQMKSITNKIENIVSVTNINVANSINVASEKIEKKVKTTSEKIAETAKDAKKKLTDEVQKAAGLTGNILFDIGKKSVDAAMNMDKAMNQFRASTGKSAEEMDRYQGILEDIYANNYGKDFEEIANGMAQVSKSMGDMPDDQLQSITESAFALRDTFEYDVNDSIKAATAMVDQFGIDGDQAMSLIAAGAQNGLDTSGNLIDNISQYSEEFAKAGFSADDMFKIMQAGADSSAFSLDTVAGALGEMSTRITSGSGEAAEGFAALGLNADEMAAKFSAGGESAKEAFDQTIKALAGMEDPLAQSQAGAALFGDAWTDMGPDVVAQLANIQDSAYDTADAMGTIKDVKYDDLGSMFEELTRSIDLLVLPLGEALMPLLEILMEALKPLAETVGDSLAPIFEKLGEAMTVLAEPLGTLIAFAGELIAPLLELVSACLNPILSLFTQLLEPLMTLMDGILGPLKELFSSLIEPLMGLVTIALQPLFDIFTALMEPLMTLIDAVLAPLQELFAALTPVLETLFSAISPIISIFSELIGMVVNSLSPVINGLADILGGVLGTAFDGLRGIIDSVMQVFQGIIDFVTGVFTGNWEQAWNGIIDIFKGIFNLIPTIIEAILNGGIGIINGLIDGINFITGAIGIPPIPHIPNVQIPRLKIGLDYVPSDFFPAFLDEGERVLTKEQNVRFNALGGLPGLEAALSGYGVAGASPAFAISLVGDVTMDGRRVGSVVLQNIDSVVRSNGG